MRVLFLGGHEFGKKTLEFLLEQSVNIVGVYVTQTDNPWYGGVRETAESHNLPVLTSTNVNSENSLRQIRELEADLIVTVNFDQILKSTLIALPPKGCINIHAALLPRYRGRAPLNWAIIKGEKETGITVHCIDEGIDSGDILLQWKMPISGSEQVGSVYDRIMQQYPWAVYSVIKGLESGYIHAFQQDHSQAWYGRKRGPDDGQIDWMDQSENIINLVRGVSHPYPGAYTLYREKKITVWAAKQAADYSAVDKELPGSIHSITPLLVNTGDGLLEIVTFDYDGDEPLETGACLG